MTSPILSELLQRTTALRALARELVGDARADDILQETAIQAMTSPPRRAGPAGGWLATVVRNLASKERRAARTRHRHEAVAARADVAPPDRSAEDTDTLRRLTEIVTSLPEPYRGTILARYLREQTPSQIAAATGTPVRTVKTRLQRGLALLRQRLDERGGNWRALLAGVFALDPKEPTRVGTTMKLSLFAAALLPVGLLIWHNLPDAARTPAETTVAFDNAPPEVGAPRPGTSLERDTAPATTPEPPAPADPVQPAGARPLADRPLMRLDVVGPAAFRAAFLPTDIGALFDSLEGEQLWRPLLAPAERLWRQWDGRGEDFGAARRRVLDYAGRIRVLWMVQPGEADERDRVFGVLAMDTDGSTDLAALAGDFAQVMPGFMPGEATERSVGEHALRVFGDARGSVTIPVVIGGCLVAFFGDASSFDEIVPRCLHALAMDAGRAAAPVSLHVDLTQLKELSEMRANPPLVKAFGLQSLRSLNATVRPDGPHLRLEVEVAFGDGDRGVLAAFMPAVNTLPSLLARVPPTATPWLTVPFRPDVLFRVAVATAAAFDEGRPNAGPDLRQSSHDGLGLYLDTDLLDHLGGEVMVLGDLWQSDDPKVFRRGDDPPLGACIAWSLQDTVAFSRGLDKLLDHLKGVVNRFETREVDGVKITRLGTAFLTGMHAAVGQDLFAMAFGGEGVAQLEALVAGGRQATARPLPAAVQRVQHLAPAGWNGLGLVDLTALFGGQVALVLEMLDDGLPRQMRLDFSADEAQEWLDRLLPLVAKHELENLVTMTGYDDGCWRLRVLW